MTDLVEQQVHIVVFFMNDKGERTWNHVWLKHSDFKRFQQFAKENDIYWVKR